MINISNCPVSGLKRKVIYKNLNIRESERRVILECTVGYFDANDEEINTNGIGRWTKNLIASTEKVNPQTGAVLTQQQLDNNDPWVYEFDFFISMKGMNIKINDLEMNEILVSDQEGKFNTQ